MLEAHEPMKRSGQNEVVISADLVEPCLVECPVVDQAASLIDDDKRKYSPVHVLLSWCRVMVVLSRLTCCQPHHVAPWAIHLSILPGYPRVELP